SVRLPVVSTCSSESRSCPKLTIGTSAPSRCSHTRSVCRISLSRSFSILIANRVIVQWFKAKVAESPPYKNPLWGVLAEIQLLYLCVYHTSGRALHRHV